MGSTFARFAAVCLCAAPLAAQAGDRAGETQPALPAELKVPPAPVLTPAEELATLRAPADVEVILVASEPLVRDPVAMAFDPDGRLWVVEMRGYMPDAVGRGEDAPVGDVAILADTDGDGRMDARTVFLDGLVLPRAIALCRGGALILAPPELLFCRDTDGDGVADERTVVDRGLGGIQSPEHAINALLPTLDNALFCANVPWRYVYSGGVWRRQASGGGGQWGAGKDDQGRVFFDGNSDPLRGDLVPSRYAARNPNLGDLPGCDVRFAEDMSVRPARMTPGVNRGYQKDFLDAQFRLRSVTAACAPWIFRGDALPEAYRGDAFVCEPSANLVLRYELAEDAAGRIVAAPARNADGLDFLTSTDERFRPVFLCDGADGALYVADMYRGLIQHRLFVTTFLRKQVDERGLAQPTGLGRIWRVAKPDWKRARPKLGAATWTELASALQSPNGWTRDTAQRLFVEDGEGDTDALGMLRTLAVAGMSWQARVQALWALAGLVALDESVCLRALGDRDARVALAAVQASERLAALGEPRIVPRWMELARSGDPRLRRQVMLSLGEVHDARAIDALVALLAEDASSPAARADAVSGLGGRELELLERIGASRLWTAEQAGRRELVALVARSLVREGTSAGIESLLALAAQPQRPAWQALAICEGALAARPPDPLGKPGWIRLARAPEAFAQRFAEARAGELGAKAAELAAVLAWPGKPGIVEVDVRALEAAELARFDRGRELYGAVCAGCHQPSGAGARGVAPPLRNSPFVLGSPARLVRIAAHGLVGDVEIAGERWNGDMPAFAASDADLASVLTYARREWGHGAEPIDPAFVARIRAQAGDRRRPWTAEELAKLAD